MAKIKNVTSEKITNTNMILKQYPRAKRSFTDIVSLLWVIEFFKSK